MTDMHKCEDCGKWFFSSEKEVLIRDASCGHCGFPYDTSPEEQMSELIDKILELESRIDDIAGRLDQI